MQYFIVDLVEEILKDKLEGIFVKGGFFGFIVLKMLGGYLPWQTI